MRRAMEWVLLVGLGAGSSGCAGRAPAAVARPAAPAPVPRCVLVDTDGGLDDVRAVIALVGGAPARGMRVAGIVTTSGIASTTGAARVMRELLRRLGAEAIPLAEGAATQSRGERDRNSDSLWWRGTAEAMNGVLGAVPGRSTDAAPAWSEGASAAGGPLREAVRAMLRGCAEVELAMLAPWTSHGAYGSELVGHRVHVTAQGCAPDFTRECGRRGYNCRLDCEACQRGVSANEVTWVSVPPDAAWAPTAAWMATLGEGRGARTLREVFTTTLGTWTCAGVPQPCIQTYLWDDSAAACILEPSRCGDASVPVCGHHRTQAPAELFEVLSGAIRAVD